MRVIKVDGGRAKESLDIIFTESNTSSGYDGYEMYDAMAGI
jgi:hypothetical protein